MMKSLGNMNTPPRPNRPVLKLLLALEVGQFLTLDNVKAPNAYAYCTRAQIRAPERVFKPKPVEGGCQIWRLE